MATTPAHNRLRILFVDDEAHLREFMRTELPRLGHDVTVCPDSKTGIEAVKTLQRDSKVPTRLRDTGLDRTLLPAIAADTLRDRGLFFNPRRTENAAPIVEILEQAW